jgi:hypothetical protein
LTRIAGHLAETNLNLEQENTRLRGRLVELEQRVAELQTISEGRTV